MLKLNFTFGSIVILYPSCSYLINVERIFFITIVELLLDLIFFLNRSQNFILPLLYVNGFHSKTRVPIGPSSPLKHIRTFLLLLSSSLSSPCLDIVTVCTLIKSSSPYLLTFSSHLHWFHYWIATLGLQRLSLLLFLSPFLPLVLLPSPSSSPLVPHLKHIDCSDLNVNFL